MKKIIISFVLFFIVATAGAIFFLYINLSSLSSDNTLKNFVINQGDSTTLIAKRLVQQNIIKNSSVFMLMAYYRGLNTKLQAGLFKLSPSMTVDEVITKLSSGGSHDYWLKILPGFRLEEIALTLKDTNSDIDPDQFLVQNKSNEGFFFPDSYLIPQDYTSQNIYDLINQNFNKKITQASENSPRIKSDQKEIVTIASLIEREARTLESKKMVSGILYNRLISNMPLQIDATVQYAKDSFGYKKLGENWTYYKFWQPVLSNDLDIVSPYNTYQNPGLPPAPICNPGYDSLFAAYHPTESDYLYYITGNDNQMHYAKTLDEHNANIAKYLR